MTIPYNAPLSDRHSASWISAFSLSEKSRVLDAGCGTGEFLLRTLEAFGCQGIGLDSNPVSLAEGKKAAEQRIPAGRLRFREADLRRDVPDGGPFKLALCIGATHAFADGEAAFESCLKSLGSVLHGGGRLLIGEGYWKKDPDPAYLAFLGEPTGIYRSHDGNICFAEEHGFSLIRQSVSSPEEWEAFETTHREKTEAAAAANPDDEKARARADFAPLWWDGFIRWGRSTMGFGFYLLQKD